MVIGAVLTLILGVGLFIKRLAMVDDMQPSTRIHTECGYINNIFEIQGNVLGMSENHEICAYNFSLKKWVHIEEPETTATSTPTKP
mgnify:CR=1 FL=1